MDKLSTALPDITEHDPTNDFSKPPLGELIEITLLVYRRVKNLDNHQSESLEATAIITESDDYFECYRTLKDYVVGCLESNGEII